jgi:very-short-patch-repair endonuclease
MLNNPQRINELLGYQWKLREMTSCEKKFDGLLKKALELYKPWDLKNNDLIEYQKIFTDGRIAYIADFYIQKYNLVIEIDGSQHDTQQEYDKKRTQFLNFYFCVNVVRFKNSELDSPCIIKKIGESLTKRKVSHKKNNLSIKEINKLRKHAREETKRLEFFSLTKLNNPKYFIPCKEALTQ